MSMFHELMMRKKEQIMYATIKGSLTESPYGVFSGFSASNYLQINQAIDFSKDVEIVLKTHTDTIRTTQYPMSWVNSSIYPSGLFVGYFNSANERYGINIRKESNTDEFVVASSPNLQNDTDVWFKFLWDSTNKVVKYGESYDGVNYRFGINKTLTENFENAIKIIIGNFGGSNPFNGSIDLNRSYIKIDNTKYKLQAVVGYTIFGSPTIVDGVVSGFSSSDYLQLPTISSTSYDKIQLHTKIKTANTIVGCCLFTVSNAYYQGLYIRTSTHQFGGYVQFGAGKNIVSDVVAVENTEYILDLIIDVTNQKLTLNVNGNIKETDNITTTTLRGLSYLLGYGYDGAFNGSMFLNETFLKINDKLWFNGQQA